MTDLDQAAADYQVALDDLERAAKARAAAHADHLATIPLLGRTRVGNGSEPTRKAHHAACQAAADARTRLDHARDQLVTAALHHTCP